MGHLTTVADMATLSNINIDGINANLKSRYSADHIYTYSGTILIAVNPYKDLSIYGQSTIKQYTHAKLDQLPPHIFAIAESAYTTLKRAGMSNDVKVNQSVVISGESGAGKTETTKFILQYLCQVTSNVSTWVEHQILEANTILEAFGNAKTVRNDNSSRFGKFMQVCFDTDWKIRGCIIQDYLLEQSRITFQSMEERNYHIFYQLVAGGVANNTIQKQYKLQSPEKYAYLSQSGCIHLAGVNDKVKFDSLRLAFNVLQIPDEYCDGIFSVLSAILWLGNLVFEDVDGEKSNTTKGDEEVIETIAELLGIEIADTRHVLLQRQINVRGNITEIPLKIQEASENRHSMAKSLYSRTFAWLIAHINKCTNPGRNSANFLGLLDIFGFENFKTNSFEQLCINYTNEKLHKFFNHYVFALEQEIYKQEGLQLAQIAYTDNSNCLELIEKAPRCILKLLTEQCHMPKGSDTSYLQNLHSEFTELNPNPSYLKTEDKREWNLKFGVVHYAGTVYYNVKGFVDKNRDTGQELFFNYIQQSTTELVRQLTVDNAENPKTGASTATMKGKPTVGDNFRMQLQLLVDVLEGTTPWYVRCIKPNMHKEPSNYDDQLVLDQLRYLGMLEIIRIRREGYPIHFEFKEFARRYSLLLGKVYRKEEREVVSQMLRNKNCNQKEWQMGHTKVFLKLTLYEVLEEERCALLVKKAILIQRVWRGWLIRKGFSRRKAAAITIQKFYASYKLRLKYLSKRRAAIVIQSHIRGFFAREVATALREMRRVEQEIKKREKRKSLEVPLELRELDMEFDNLYEFLSESNYEVGGRGEGKQKDDGEEDHISLTTASSIHEEMTSIDSSSSISKSPSPLPPPEISSPKIALHKPTLPEPTVPPPPPPPMPIPLVQPVTVPVPVCPPLPKVKHEEPIYESIKPRPEPVVQNGVKGPPPPGLKGSPRIVQKVVSVPPRNQQSPLPQPTIPTPCTKETRKQKRIERHLQEIETVQKAPDPTAYNDLIEYAQEYFNSFEKSDNLLNTLRRKSTDCVSKSEMITYTKNCSISNSHVHLYDPGNVQVAVFMFRDLGKYMRSELKPDLELTAIQTIIGYGIEREELRDEIYVQIMRQCNGNPSEEYLEKLWLLFCLVVVSFSAGKLLQKYVASFIAKQIEETQSTKLKQQMEWCAENCVKVGGRKLPPSSVEIAAMTRLGTIVCRFFFLDGRTKAIDIQPTDTAVSAISKLSSKIGLANTEGWAIYEQGPDYEHHVPAHHYMYDVIAGWELKNNYKKKSSVCGGENRFIFKRRLFKATRDISEDPMEVHLLYAQAVWSVVKRDEYPVAEKVALQLAGLQSQVLFGDPKGTENYANIDGFLPQRISRTRPHQQWVPILHQAHRQYGSGKSELVSKVWYLSCVMQYPLYGTTMFPVVYRGYWLYGNSLVLGINSEGINMIKSDDKFIMYEYPWHQIESITMETAEKIITIKLSKSLPPDTHKCFVFESASVAEIGGLVRSYCPSLNSGPVVGGASKERSKPTTNDDRLRLYQNILNARRQLVDADILRKPTDNLTNNIMKTLRRISKSKLEKLRQEYEKTDYKGYNYSYWCFSKSTNVLTKLTEEDEQTALLVITNLTNYSGLTGLQSTEEESATTLQILLEKCWKNNGLLQELYMQLIKQTTDHPEPNSKINIRNWAALSLLSSLIVPGDMSVRRYLICHLKKCGSDSVTEEGRYARWAESCLLQTMQSQTRRQWPPSKQEIISTINRRLVSTRIHLMDGKFHTVYFGPNETASDVLVLLIGKIGLPETAKGYAIYETSAPSWERSLLSDEKLVEVMARWERQRSASSTQQLNFKFVLKKHLFIDVFMDWDHPVEKELLHHQLLHCARNDRFPISDTEAAMLVALQAQVELGDYRSSSAGEFPDYCHVSAHCLPTRIAALVSHEAVARHHQSLVSTPVAEAKRGVMNLLHSWPLHRAAIFDVGQCFTSNWPRLLWLAVDQQGVHLLQQRSRSTLCSFNYELIVSYSPSHTHFMLITSIDSENPKPSKIILTTTQGYQISQLIKEYIDVVFETDKDAE